MGWPLRMYGEDEVLFVSARTTQARLLLRPSAQLNEVVGGVLARAAARHGVVVYGFVFVSNHVHLLVRARDGVLSKFMQYLLSNLARKVGRLVNWPGPFWGRRFSAEPVLDDEGMENSLKYILAHGVKEGLVRHVLDWPGLSCAQQLLGTAKRSFKWFDWSCRWKKGQLSAGGEDLLADKWSELVELELAPLPHWERWSPEARIAAALRMIQSIEEEGRAAHPVPLGRAKVEAMEPHMRPENPKRTPRPLCHGGLRELRHRFLETYRAFTAAYRDASERFRNGDLLVEFPTRAFRPPGFTMRV